MLPEVPFELLRKYDKAGPRYTSYPTAPHFSPDVSSEGIHKEREASLLEKGSRPLSLYFHVPFCPVICLYCGCHTEPTRDKSRISGYMDAMLAETRQFAARYPSKRRVRQIHFGGGTPTHAGLPALRHVLETVRTHFALADDAEVACEVDPRRIDAAGLAELRAMGFNRISFGIQDLDPEVQRAVGRVQSPQMCLDMVTAARELGFFSVNIDLIYGLPKQSVATGRATLDFVLEKMKPDRLALFNFAYLPALKPHQKLLDVSAMPPPEEKLAMLKHGIDYLVKGGYEFIGMDHFALPKDDLAVALREGRLHRNFQGYTTMADVDIVGFGVSSISQFSGAYTQNLKDEQQYIARIDSEKDPMERGILLTLDDRIRREVIMSILCRGGVRMRDIEEKFSIDFSEYFETPLSQLDGMVSDALVTIDAERISVTPSGRLFVRNVAMLFDTWLDRAAAAGKPQYSRTV